MTHPIFYGYVYVAGRYGQPVRLEGSRAVSDFIKTNLFAEELRICDTSDQLLFHSLDGVDVFNGLGAIGIDLPGLFRSVREQMVQTGDESPKKEEWEELYDRMGLSPAEVAMRQRVKKAAMTARTVADVAELVRGTYFNARFYSPDDQKCWGYFDETDLTVQQLFDKESGWEDAGQQIEARITLSPGARVQHRSSREDVHLFTLLDVPEE